MELNKKDEINGILLPTKDKIIATYIYVKFAYAVALLALLILFGAVEGGRANESILVEALAPRESIMWFSMFMYSLLYYLLVWWRLSKVPYTSIPKIYLVLRGMLVFPYFAVVAMRLVYDFERAYIMMIFSLFMAVVLTLSCLIETLANSAVCMICVSNEISESEKE